MAAGDGGLWRTLVLIYATVLTSAVCVPPVTVLPLLFGFDSLLVVFAFGCLGLGLSALVVTLLTAQVDAVLTRVAGETPGLTDERPSLRDATRSP